MEVDGKRHATTNQQRAEEPVLIRDKGMHSRDCNQGNRGTFNDGEGVKLSRKAMMLHVDTLNNKLQNTRTKTDSTKKKNREILN